MYYLKSKHKIYDYGDTETFSTLDEALTKYDETVKGMMKFLPKSEWFDLQIWKNRTEDDPLYNNSKYNTDVIIRSWVY